MPRLKFSILGAQFHQVIVVGSNAQTDAMDGDEAGVPRDGLPAAPTANDAT
jgi:hypothetical protein